MYDSVSNGGEGVIAAVNTGIKTGVSVAAVETCTPASVNWSAGCVPELRAASHAASVQILVAAGSSGTRW